jgi:hypothetical protein
MAADRDVQHWLADEHKHYDVGYPLPHYTAAQTCGYLSGAMDNGKLYRVCVSEEQSYLDYLRVVWPDLTQETQKVCLSTVGNATVTKYEQLAGCVMSRYYFDVGAHGPSQLH